MSTISGIVLDTEGREMNRAIFIGYVTTLGLLVVFNVFRMFTDQPTMLVVYILLTLVLLVALLANLAATLIKANKRKAVRFAVVLVASAFALSTFRIQTDVGDLLFWKFHRTDLERLVSTLQEQPRIVRMDRRGNLNGVSVTTDPSRVSSEKGMQVDLLGSLLARHKIEKQGYDSILDQLQKIGLASSRRAGDCIVFEKDGMLDTRYGYIWTPPEIQNDEIKTQVGGDVRLAYLRRLDESWLYYNTGS